MRCTYCRATIASGVEAAKMVVEYEQPDNTIKIFGYQMPDGPLTAATGTIHRGWHFKCWQLVRKREARGDAVTGRVLGAAILGAYDRVDGEDTRAVTARLAALQRIATAVGKPVGDPHVTEAYLAQQAGGPYRHTHQFPLDMYQLLAHLHHAHGMPGVESDARGLHAQLHTRLAAEAIRADRHADGETGPVPESDWREQLVAELDELT